MTSPTRYGTNGETPTTNPTSVGQLHMQNNQSNTDGVNVSVRRVLYVILAMDVVSFILPSVALRNKTTYFRCTTCLLTTTTGVVLSVFTTIGYLGTFVMTIAACFLVGVQNTGGNTHSCLSLMCKGMKLAFFNGIRLSTSTRIEINETGCIRGLEVFSKYWRVIRLFSQFAAFTVIMFVVFDHEHWLEKCAFVFDAFFTALAIVSINVVRVDSQNPISGDGHPKWVTDHEYEHIVRVFAVILGVWNLFWGVSDFTLSWFAAQNELRPERNDEHWSTYVNLLIASYRFFVARLCLGKFYRPEGDVLFVNEHFYRLATSAEPHQVLDN